MDRFYRWNFSKIPLLPRYTCCFTCGHCSWKTPIINVQIYVFPSVPLYKIIHELPYRIIVTVDSKLSYFGFFFQFLVASAVSVEYFLILDTRDKFHLLMWLNWTNLFKICLNILINLMIFTWGILYHVSHLVTQNRSIIVFLLILNYFFDNPYKNTIITIKFILFISTNSFFSSLV